MTDKNEYPYNLIYDIVGDDFDYPADIEGSLEYVLVTTLTERERRCVSMYYHDGMALGKMAGNENVTRERIKQIIAKSVRKLRSSSRINCIKKGIAKMLFEQQEKDQIMLEQLNFSTRTYNVLQRAGVHTLRQLAELSYNKTIRIRNLGQRSLDEINDKLKECGYPPKVELLDINND